MGESSNNLPIETSKKEVPKLDTLQKTEQQLQVSEASDLSTKLEALLGGTEFESQSAQFQEIFDAFPDDQEMILDLIKRAFLYKKPEILTQILSVDTFGESTQFIQISESMLPDAVNIEKQSQETVHQEIEKITQFFIANGIKNYTPDISVEELFQSGQILNESQIQELQTLLQNIQNIPKTDNVLHTNFSQLETHLKGIINFSFKQAKVEVEKAKVEVELKTKNLEEAIKTLKGLGDKIIPVRDVVFKHAQLTPEQKEKYNNGQIEEVFIEALTKIAQDKNTQAIEDILMVAAQADPKGVEGETFKAFYAVFETSGVDKTQLDAMRERIINRSENKEALLQTSSSSDLFPGAKNVSGEVRLDEKGNFVFENQKLDIGEKPPGLYLVGKDNFEIKTKDRGYYKELVEKNKKDTELKHVGQELANTKNEISRLNPKNENLEEIRSEKLEQLTTLSDTEDPLYKSLKEEIDDLEERIILLSTLQEKVSTLEQQITTLKGDISILVESLTQKKDSLNTQKEKTQDTVNFLDNIGFTHIQKDDIDWIVTQVNSFDATYYGFSQPLNFENGFDYQTNKGYQEFMKFFDTLIYGKNPKDMKKGVTGTDQNTFIDGRDKSRSNVSFRNDLITQGVLREDGRLNQFNFFQKFSSRNTEKQPTANTPKEGSEAKQ